MSLSSAIGVDALLAERRRFVETLESLSEDEFEHGRTLCAEWAPRDVLAHAIGVDSPAVYVRRGGNINKANADVVGRMRSRTRDQLLTAGNRWAASAPPAVRLAARLLIGDVSVHHQDVLRGLGRRRELPAGIAGAVFREGLLLAGGSRRGPLFHRLEPTTGEARPLGRGPIVRGPTEALGLWLAGRRGLDDELEIERRGGQES